MIHSLIAAAVVAVAYGVYKHYTLAQVKTIVLSYEASAVAEVKKLVAEVKAKL